MSFIHQPCANLAVKNEGRLMSIFLGQNGQCKVENRKIQGRDQREIKGKSSKREVTGTVRTCKTPPKKIKTTQADLGKVTISYSRLGIKTLVIIFGH